jgi:hypothetical protein
MKKQVQIFTAECYRFNTDRKKKIRVLSGTFEENRDNLTPCMIWTREFLTTSLREAKKLVRQTVNTLNENENEKKYTFQP